MKANKKITILIADKINRESLKLLPHSKFDVDVNTGLTNSQILKLKKKYDVLIIRSTRKINKAYLSKCSQKVIASATKGLDHIDLKSAKEFNIKIINSETGNVVSAAEHTFALILEIYKKISYADKLIRDGKFSQTNFERIELRGKTIGIIGIGKVGLLVAKFAKAFSMNIIANDIDPAVKIKHHNLNFKSINYLLKNSEVISIHIPLNEKNHLFFSKSKLGLLSGNSILINTSRGKVIDESYFIKMLKTAKIRYAGLDVFWNEPNINKQLLPLRNVVLTNHIAGKTNESMKFTAYDIINQVKNNFNNFQFMSE